MCAAVQRLGNQRSQLPGNPHPPVALDNIAGNQNGAQMPSACALHIAREHAFVGGKGANDGSGFTVIADRTDNGGGTHLHIVIVPSQRA